ncbi:MAG: ATP-binding cassette domain-containing protein [Chitinophagaceae bacterium]|nr:ATP-binding cassette domain-containing protein [Chitinophagaceae bacterium]
MTISLSDAGKRFNREWIFRHLTYNFEKGGTYAITGPNGSGKSTLLQVIAGSMHTNEGIVHWAGGNTQLAIGNRQWAMANRQLPIANSHVSPKDKKWTISNGHMTMVDSSVNQASLAVGDWQLNSERVFRWISIGAPYMEVVEEMTLTEFLNFHHGFKPFLNGLTTSSIIAILGLEKAANKQIRYYSSGMKQRVKLGQAIFSDTPVILLDEPCTNLDAAGIELYHRMVSEYCSGRLVIVSSNDKVEYRFCQHQLSISEYKQ